MSDMVNNTLIVGMCVICFILGFITGIDPTYSDTVLTPTQLNNIYNDTTLSCLNDSTLVTITITPDHEYTYICSDGSSRTIYNKN